MTASLKSSLQDFFLNSGIKALKSLSCNFLFKFAQVKSLLNQIFLVSQYFIFKIREKFCGIPNKSCNLNSLNETPENSLAPHRTLYSPGFVSLSYSLSSFHVLFQHSFSLSENVSLQPNIITSVTYIVTEKHPSLFKQ